MGKPTKAEQAALKVRAIELSGLAADQFDALSEDERKSLLATAQAEADLAANQTVDKVAAADAETHPREGLVAMELNGEEIFVHPTCVDDHARIGWKLV